MRSFAAQAQETLFPTKFNFTRLCSERESMSSGVSLSFHRHTSDTVTSEEALSLSSVLLELTRDRKYFNERRSKGLKIV